MRIHRPSGRLTLLTLHLLVGATTAAFAQTASSRAEERRSAEWVVDAFYAHPSFPERASHITGEFKANYADAPTMGSLIPRGVRVSSRALLQDTDRAVFATSLSGAARDQDWYTYLRREQGTWKIEAVRTLSFPRAHYVLIDSMEARRVHGRLVDSVVPTLETMQLAVRSDSALKRYLLDHQSALRELVRRFGADRIVAISADGNVAPTGVIQEAERRSFASALRGLRLGAMMRDQRSPACVFVKIGGVIDNDVGYIYAPDGCVRPPLSPKEFIYVEEVAPHWLVYKTT
jgi:hypothetical protein